MSFFNVTYHELIKREHRFTIAFTPNTDLRRVTSRFAIEAATKPVIKLEHETVDCIFTKIKYPRPNQDTSGSFNITLLDIIGSERDEDYPKNHRLAWRTRTSTKLLKQFLKIIGYPYVRNNDPEHPIDKEYDYEKRGSYFLADESQHITSKLVKNPLTKDNISNSMLKDYTTVAFGEIFIEERHANGNVIDKWEFVNPVITHIDFGTNLNWTTGAIQKIKLTIEYDMLVFY